MLIEGLDADMTATGLPAGTIQKAENTGTIPAMPGTPALTYKPIEQARGWYTLYAYSSNPAAAPDYYQWTFTPGVRPAVNYVGQKPYPPYPPMGQFLSLDSARAAMVAHLNMVSATMPQQPMAPSPILATPMPLNLSQPGAVQVYASPFLPTPASVAAAQAAPNLAPAVAPLSIPPWAMVAAAAGVVGFLIIRRSRSGSRRAR